MAKIKDKVENALDESRMLVLGAQVLVGFQFRSVFEPGFDSLPLPTKWLRLVALGLMLVAVGLIVRRRPTTASSRGGEDTERRAPLHLEA